MMTSTTGLNIILRDPRERAIYAENDTRRSPCQGLEEKS